MIELKNITKIYNHNNQEQVVLDNISHVFKEGSNTSILGESGSGKTTLLNIIGGIDLDYEGEVYFNGEVVKDFDQFRREYVSFIFQDLNLINHLSLIKNITVSLTNDVKNREEKAEALLKRVGLYDHRDKKPHQLSGGEKQRVAIARALARDTDILLCDEPTGSLDDETKNDIMSLIVDVFKDRTILFVTHDDEMAEKYSDTIFQFESGSIKIDLLHYPKPQEKKNKKKRKNKNFNKRFEFNLLSKKFSLFHASYLIIIIAGLFMFGTGIISGIESEVDNYYIEKHKVDKIDVRTTRFSVEGFRGFVDSHNEEHGNPIIGFMTGLDMKVTYPETEISDNMYLRNIQPVLRNTFEEDIVIGKFPEKNNEVLYSKGAAVNSLVKQQINDSDDQSIVVDLYRKTLNLSDEDLFNQIKSLEISYKNTYKFNDENFYDNDLIIVGLIDDYKYSYNEEITFEIGDKIESFIINSNVYMLEEEFLEFIYLVHLGYYGIRLNDYSVFIEEEDFELRNEVFAEFLLEGFQIAGRDYVTQERDDYHKRLEGYKITLIAGCLLVMVFGGISVYNGIQTNIERNKRNIGIYKSLGYTSKNIKSMFVTEGFIISIFTIVVSIVMWFVIKLIMTQYIVNVLDPSDKFGFTNVAHLAPYSLVIVFIVVVAIIMTSINQEFKKINIINLIKHK